MFLLIPVGVQYNARRYPVVTFTLMGINVALYLLSLFFFFYNFNGYVEDREWVVFHLGMVPADNVWWTYLTSMFVHADFFHILGNMIYLFLFGACLEDMIGRGPFTLFYLFSGVIATVAYTLVTPAGPASTIPLVGASGAISACVGGFALILAKTKINFRYFVWFVFRFWSGDFWLPAWLVISFWFLMDLFWAVLSYHLPHSNGGVAFAAHVGGTLVGAGLIALWRILPPRFKPTGEPDEHTPTPIYVNVNSNPEAQEIASIYLYQNGTQLGPFTSVQITRMRALGSLDPQTSYWQDGMTEWRHVSEFSPL
ncbi:MAG: rhomboid family intramembrane serine protease [Verrucomicrobiota bacterium]